MMQKDTEKNWYKVGVIISGISAIVGLLTLLLEHNIVVLYICIGIVIISSVITGVYWVKSYPI